jgi:hypothetical protein
MSREPIWQQMVHFVDNILEYYGIIGDDAATAMAWKWTSGEKYKTIARFFTYGRGDIQG